MTMDRRVAKGGRVGRGDIRPLLLCGLLAGPAHGYELMHRLEEASGRTWTPSPGSVYPTLQLMEEEGLLTSVADGGRRTYALTPAGKTLAKAAAKGPRPWEDGDGVPGRGELRDLTHAVHAAAKQVGTQGTAEQIEQAMEILRAARKALYGVLAED
jgi:DNA-binding PadR family transcriptional regulator